MPPDMAISMRHNKLKPEEAALLAGEVNKPSWESRNEGIHERVSFEDTIWGFDLAGGSYYKTPLRVTYVKKGSRAEKAGIRPGDKLKRINDIDTSTLTIQEAHDIIVSSGVHLKIAVTAPEDEEDSYHCYQDEVDENGYDSDEERRRQEELAKKRQVHARVSHYWSLQWPWVSKRRVIYRESNCFMVPSKFEEQHKEKFPPRPILRLEDDIALSNINKEHIFKKFDKVTLDREQDLKRRSKSKEKSVEKTVPKTEVVSEQNVAPLKDILTNGATEIINTKEHDVMQRFLSEVPEMPEEEQEISKNKDEVPENEILNGVDDIESDGPKSSEINSPINLTNGFSSDETKTTDKQEFKTGLANGTENNEVSGPKVTDVEDKLLLNESENSTDMSEVIQESTEETTEEQAENGLALSDLDGPESTELSEPENLTDGAQNGEVHGPESADELAPEGVENHDDVINEILNQAEQLPEQQQDEILDGVVNEGQAEEEHAENHESTD